MARRKRFLSPSEERYRQACLQWNGKPYYSLDHYLRQQFGQKIYKIAIDGGMTCPNRDGTKGTTGCSFCSAGGSGDFAVSRAFVAGSCGEASPFQSAIAADSCGDASPFQSAFAADSCGDASPFQSAFAGSPDKFTPAQTADSTGIVTKQLNEGIRRLQSGRKYCGDRYIAYFQSYSNTCAPFTRRHWHIHRLRHYPLRPDRIVLLRRFLISCRHVMNANQSGSNWDFRLCMIRQHIRFTEVIPSPALKRP